MKRVIISSSAFKLSAAGFDASTASGTGLIFDGFGGYVYSGVYIAGYQTAYSGSTATVNFGKTFSNPPGALIRLHDINHSNALMHGYVGPGTPASGASASYTIRVYTDHLTVTVTVSGGYAGQIPFSYFVTQI